MAVYRMIIGLHLLAFIPSILSDCGICGLSGIACTGLSEFQACFNGELSILSSSGGGSCPSNTYCNADSEMICQSDLLMASCIPAEMNECGVCSSNGRFACTNATAFGFCFGSTTISSDVVVNCPNGQYCNVNEAAPGFCTSDPRQITCLGDISDTTLASSTTSTRTAAPTTSSTTTSTTTPTSSTRTSLSNNATQLCLNKRVTGRFGMPQDTTCKSYYYCFFNKFQWRGQYFECTGYTFFDRDQQRCVFKLGYACLDGLLVYVDT